MRTRKLSLGAAALLLILSGSIFAAEPDAEGGVQYGKLAKLVERTPPRYPMSALEKGQEGWVLVSFVVGTDGTVTDPVVVDSNGISAFERAALRNVKQWTYEPATFDGTPVEQCVSRTLVTFAIETGNKRGARQQFMSFSRRFDNALKNNDLDKAAELLAAAQQRGYWNLYESGRLWVSSYRLADARGDNAAALASIRRATQSRRWLRPEVAYQTLQTQFVLELRLGEISDALRTYDAILEEFPDEASQPHYVDVVERVRSEISGQGVLAYDANLPATNDDSDQATKTHDLLRRSVSVEVADGNIESVDIRCEWHRAFDDEVTAERVWTLPESWGECDLVVSGSPGTSYRLYELPVASAN